MTVYTFKSDFTTKIDFRQAKSPKTNNLTLVYTHGLYSDCWGRKPEAILNWCETKGIDFIRYELAGHGSDSARYEQADLNIWKAQILEVIDEIVKTDVILAGSSLGGWLSLLAARERPGKVKGVLGLAAAPDFTLDLENYVFTPEQKEKLSAEGRLEFTNNDFTYVFTKALFETGKENSLLGKPLPVVCPVHLIQGQKDASLDPNKALNIAKCLESSDVVVKLLKDSNHRLGKDEDLAEICCSLEALYARAAQN